jgi:hypothetical protein
MRFLGATWIEAMNSNIVAASGSSFGLPATAGVQSVLRSGSAPPQDDVNAMQALFERAHSLALRGDHQEAQPICAHAILQFQPLLAGDGGMLRAAFAVLIVARSFKLLARLARATSGQTIRVLVVSDEAPLQVRLSRQRDSFGIITYTIHCRESAVLSARHPLIQSWSAELALGARLEN